MAFHGTPLEALDDDAAEEAFTGAMLVATLIDEQRATRLYLERIDKMFQTALKMQGKRRR